MATVEETPQAPEAPAEESAKPKTPAAPKKTAAKKGAAKKGTAKPKADSKKKDSKPKAPPTYGGHAGDPDMGANGRRVMLNLREERGVKAANEILRKAEARTLAGNGLMENKDKKGAFVKSTKTDRFIRWETITTVAGIKPDDARKLVASLGRKEGAKAAGLRS
jgi:hypothetical protein